MSQQVALDDSCVVRYRSLGEAVCKALSSEAARIGFEQNQVPDISWQSLRFSVVKDPADGSECLSGDWLNKAGYRIGCFQLNGDGSFFAEHDVALPHPSDKRWFVEAVTAWGRDSQIVTEPRMLAAV